ncbi:MAG: hypothetical protein H7Y32_08480 [Chloroflexales bacterium]|nr:hypothetical protein [Chloroflexales bacterium]
MNHITVIQGDAERVGSDRLHCIAATTRHVSRHHFGTRRLLASATIAALLALAALKLDRLALDSQAARRLTAALFAGGAIACAARALARLISFARTLPRLIALALTRLLIGGRLLTTSSHLALLWRADWLQFLDQASEIV